MAKIVRATILNNKPVRWRLVEDDDGHWYLIPADQNEAFDAWINAGPYWDGYEGEDFDKYRINGSPTNVTFTDPVEE